MKAYELMLILRPNLEDEAREAVLAECRKRGIAFLEAASPQNIAARIDDGVRVVAVGTNAEAARIGRAHSRRTMPV